MQSGEKVLVKSTLEIFADKRLSPNTPVVNNYERLMKEVLLEEKINAYYELQTFPTDEKKAYLPDFITCMQLNGKIVAFELHSSAEEDYVSKLSNFSRIYGFYTILISHKDIYGDRLKNIKEKIGGYWYLPNGVDDPKVYANKKEELRSMLRRFIDNKEPLMLDTEEIESQLNARIEYIKVIKEQFRRA